MNTGDIIRLKLLDGTHRVWKVTAILLGGERQESVVELETMDLIPSTEGPRLLVPYCLIEHDIEWG